MALWQYSKDKPHKVSFYRDDMGADAYLYLPGPSLKYVDFDVRVPGTISFAVNTAYPKVVPHYWVGMDKPECYHNNLLHEGIIKFFRASYGGKDFKDKKLFTYPNTFFADIAKPPQGIISMFINDRDIYFSWLGHTLGVAMHLILWMGAKKIHLVGCDLGGNSDYYDDRVLSPEQRDYNRRTMEAQRKFLEEVNAVAKLQDIEIISCTPESPINKFLPYKDLKFCIEESRAKCGEVREMKHVLDITTENNKKVSDQIQWADPVRPKGVVVMCDKTQEWMLDWWYENYKRWNEYPIQFIDLGMSPEGVRFCKARGDYAKLPELEFRKSWFKKPFGLKLSHFKKTVFMDLDIEVRGNIYDLFEMNGLAMCRDVFNRNSLTKNTFNSGLIVFDHGTKLIDDWIQKVYEKFMVAWSDQDCFDLVTKEVNEIPPSVCALRINGPNPKSLMYHWTGPSGKETIKKFIEQG